MSTLRITRLEVATTTIAAGTGEELTHALNRVAGTVALEAQGAAQVWADAPGMELLGCLNKKNGTSGVGLLGVLNSLAGTDRLDVNAAAAHLT